MSHVTQMHDSSKNSHLLQPPDPINNVCPLSGIQISEFLLTLPSSTNIEILYGGSEAPKSDPPHKIMWYWIHYSTWLSRSFPPDQSGQAEMIYTS